MQMFGVLNCFHVCGMVYNVIHDFSWEIGFNLDNCMFVWIVSTAHTGGWNFHMPRYSTHKGWCDFHTPMCFIL